MNNWILRIYEDYVTATIFLPFNVTEWLASSGGTKCLKPIEEMSKGELNVFLKRFCTSARKKDGTLSLQMFIKEIHLIVPSLAIAQQTIFSLISDPYFTEANKAFVKDLRKTGNIVGVLEPRNGKKLRFTPDE